MDVALHLNESFSVLCDDLQRLLLQQRCSPRALGVSEQLPCCLNRSLFLFAGANPPCAALLMDDNCRGVMAEVDFAYCYLDPW